MISYPGIFIMIDGIAGSGKGTLIESLKIALAESGTLVFDMNAWNQVHTDPPVFEEVSDYDVYFCFEPTKQWMGSAIRKEVSFHPERYSARVQAEAFALDRMIQYHRFVLPALQAGKTVIQERGITTSLVYQGRMDDTIDRRGVAEIPGNQLALKYPPTHFILTHLDPGIAQERRATRDDMSKGAYEDTELLRRAQETFQSKAFYDFMEVHGTQLHTIDTSGDMQASINAFHSLIHSLIRI